MRSQSAVQPKDKRTRNFQEVSLGYLKRLAIEQARRYPQSQDSGSSACPLEIDIPGFMRRLREGDVDGAFAVIRDKNPMPGVCGRICPAPCEKGSPVGIRSLERYAADHAHHKVKKSDACKSRIAVVGSGPAGLAAAYELALHQYKVTILETLDKPGGVLRYGIPEFRLPQKVLDEEIQAIVQAGVDIRLNCFVGQTIRLEHLWQDGYKAVLLATGSGVPRFLEIPGANLSGVYYGEEFLMRINTMKRRMFGKREAHFPIGPRVLVIGSGNTALDSARSARRLGCQVSLAFLRSEKAMRVDAGELDLAREEGITLIPFAKPVEMIANDAGDVKAVRILKVKEDDLTPLSGLEGESTIEADTVVIAVGHHPNVWLKKFIPELDLNADQTLKVDAQTGMTSVKGVFAAGNVVSNGGSVVAAMVAGKQAAEKIEQFLK